MAALHMSVNPSGTRGADTAFKPKVSGIIYVLSNVSGRLCVVTWINFEYWYLLITIFYVRYKPALILISLLANSNMISMTSILKITINNDDNENYLLLIIIAILSNRTNLNWSCNSLTLFSLMTSSIDCLLSYESLL